MRAPVGVGRRVERPGPRRATRPAARRALRRRAAARTACAAPGRRSRAPAPSSGDLHGPRRRTPAWTNVARTVDPGSSGYAAVSPPVMTTSPALQREPRARRGGRASQPTPTAGMPGCVGADARGRRRARRRCRRHADLVEARRAAAASPEHHPGGRRAVGGVVLEVEGVRRPHRVDDLERHDAPHGRRRAPPRPRRPGPGSRSSTSAISGSTRGCTNRSSTTSHQHARQGSGPRLGSAMPICARITRGGVAELPADPRRAAGRAGAR